MVLVIQVSSKNKYTKILTMLSNNKYAKYSKQHPRYYSAIYLINYRYFKKLF